MLRRLYRPLGVLALLAFLCVSVPVLTNPGHLSEELDPYLFTSSERFLSYFSHGDFIEQYKALRTATRLAYETNRTLVVPPLRLVPPRLVDESSSKVTDSSAAVDAGINGENPGSEGWVDIPWSSLMDFDRVRSDFAIRLVDQADHEWPGRVDWVHLSRSGTPARKPRLTLRSWLQRPFLQYRNRQENSSPQPMRIHQLQDLVELPGRYVHCGILATSVFKLQLLATQRQQVLYEALSRHLLLRPDRLAPLTATADRIVHTLGGPGHFSSLTLRLAKYIGSGSSNKKRQQRQQSSASFLVITVADERVLVRAMADIALDVFSSIPINQGVAAALPIEDPLLTTLAQVPPWRATDPTSRRQLLQACVAYREKGNPHYPIFYLTTTDLDFASHPRIYKPLLESFPCIFTKADMYRWGDIDPSWWWGVQQVASIHEDDGEEGARHPLDVEALLSPIVDIMVAGQGYSHLEIPSSAFSSIISSLQQVNTTSTSL